MSGHRAHHQNACNRILGPEILADDALSPRIGSWGHFERLIKMRHTESRRDNCEPATVKTARGRNTPLPCAKERRRPYDQAGAVMGGH